MKMEIKKLAMLFFSVIFLASCTFNPFTRQNHLTGNPAAAAIGAGVGAGSMALLGAPKAVILLAGISGGALGYYVTTLRFDSGGIIQSGGQVYRIGHQVGIEIPTDSLFESNTDEFTENAEPILNSAVAVLARFPRNNILVSGNTSGFDRPKRERRLSEKRAERVAMYLWDNGINNFQGHSIRLRKLKYVGYGNYFPIATNLTAEGIRMNSRIQISSYPDGTDLHLDTCSRVFKNIGSLDGDELCNKPINRRYKD